MNVPQVILCNGCYIKLNKNLLIEVVDYEVLGIKIKRNGKQCSCKICSVSRLFCSTKTKVPMFTLFVLRKRCTGRPSNCEALKKVLSMKICKKCSLLFRRGIRHACNVTSKVSNIVKIAGKCVQQVASTIIERQQNSQGSPNCIRSIEVEDHIWR